MSRSHSLALGRPMGECPQTQTVADFLAGRLDSSRRQEMEAHVDRCAVCDGVVARLLSQKSEAPHGPVPPVATTLTDGTPGGEVLVEGQKLGRYILIGRVGAGGMGSVWAAYDTVLDRKIALKFLSRTGPALTELAQIQAEASAMAKFSHPNVVTVHDVGVFAGKAYLAMEFVDGATLSAWRMRQPRSIKEICRVMAGAARGLAALHAQGIVHRDVKPQNILVSGTRVLVTDFGLSVRIQGSDGAGRIAGTPAYMAPEQMRGEAVDARADVFGFCATLFEMIHGLPPFTDITPEAVKARVEAGRGPSVPPGSKAPAWLHRLALRGLAADRASRPANLDAFADELLADPMATRRRAAIAAVAVAAAAGAFWGGGYLKGNPERRCAAGAEVMSATWNDARRAQLRGQYQAANLGSVWPLLERRLQDYADRWRAKHAETCTATYGERRQSEAVLDLRMDCLYAQRTTIDALFQTLAKATTAQLNKAAAARLPVADECDAAGRAGTKPLPADPGVRAEIARIEAALGQVDAHRFMSEFDQAARYSQPALEAARKLGYEPLLARALNAAGSIETWRGGAGGPTGDHAAELLGEAVAQAEVGRDDLRRMYAMTDLIMNNSFRDHYPEAELWASLASAILTKIGHPLPFYRSLLDNAIGWLKFSKGQREAARAAFDRALQTRREFLPRNHPLVISSLNGSCIVRPTLDEQNACFREALTLAESAYPPTSADVASIANNLAIGLMKRPKTLDQACPMVRRAIAIKEVSLEPGHSSLLDDINNLGMCVRFQGKLTEALALFEKGLSRAKPGTAPHARLQAGYGVTLTKLGRFDEGLREIRQAQADRRRLFGAGSRLLLDTTADLALALIGQGHPAEALKETDAAIADCARTKSQSSYLIDLHNLRGQALQALGRHEQAIAAHKDALRVSAEMSAGSASSSGDTEPPEVARSAALQGIGAAQLGQKQSAAAIDSLEQALAMRLPGEVASDLRADTLLQLARAYWAPGARRSPRRSCELGQEAIEGYRSAGELGQERLREAQRFVAEARCQTS